MHKALTPDVIFQDLHAYEFRPNCLAADGHPARFLDESDPSGDETIFALHSEPGWPYLTQIVISLLFARLGVIAMEFIGFGRGGRPSTSGHD
jgi:hypothetical protein